MSLRALVKTVAAETLGRTGAGRLWSSAPARRALVLGYHQVLEDARKAGPSIPAMVITTATLERQLDWVGRHYRFVSLDELGRRLESGGVGERPLAAVTFDDGYRDVYEHAFPLLQRKGIPGAVFAVTDLVGTDRLLLHDRLYLLVAHVLAQPPSARARLVRRVDSLGLSVPVLQRPQARTKRDAFAITRALLEAVPSAGLEALMKSLAPAMGAQEEPPPELRLLDWDMVRAMHRAGFAVGSHTTRHALLTLEGPDRVRKELAASRKRLESELGAPVRHFAYPDGRYHGAVVEAVSQAGYAFGYTTCGHFDRRHPLLTVPRRLLWENSCRDALGRFSPSLMRGQTQGLFDLFGRCRQDHRAAQVPRRRQAMA